MIPVNEPALLGRELEYVAECVRSGWISSGGRFIEQFEQSWAEYCGRRYGIAVSSGTTALQTALRCLELSPGDEVIMPSFTIISCALAVVDCGAVPVLVDCDQKTWCMDLEQVARKVGPRTKVVMPVHIYGHPVNMEHLLEVAGESHLTVVEDAAEAHGAECRVGGDQGDWHRCGSFGALSCFSFYANKVITTGEGGMVLTDDERLATRARALRNLFFEPSRRFLHQELGYNYRFTNLQAAIGVAQIERIDEAVRRKRSIGQLYTELLRGVKGVQLPAEEAWAHNVYWMYGLVLEPNVPLDAAALSVALANRGVETRPFFLGLHEQPALRARGLFAGERYPVTERLARRGLYLPSGLTLTDTDIERVAGAVAEVLRAAS